MPRPPSTGARPGASGDSALGGQGGDHVHQPLPVGVAVDLVEAGVKDVFEEAADGGALVGCHALDALGRPAQVDEELIEVVLPAAAEGEAGESGQIVMEALDADEADGVPAGVAQLGQPDRVGRGGAQGGVVLGALAAVGVVLFTIR